MDTIKRRRIALLLGDSETNNSKIIGGIVAHMRHQMLDWNLLVPIAARDAGAVTALAQYADAFIVSAGDCDQATQHALQALHEHGETTVCISLSRPANAHKDRPPTVYADNAALVQSAYVYLTGRCAGHFALFGAPPEASLGCLEERAQVFIAHARRERATVSEFRCGQVGYPMFNGTMQALSAWLDSLPRPVAIFATDELRARMLSQACALAGYNAASGIVIVGVDSDPLAQELSPVPLASIMLDRAEMGRRGAQLLQRVLEQRAGAGELHVAPMALVAPPGDACAPVHDACVMRALHYIRLNAKRGIKAEQVAYYVGMSRSSLELRFRRDMARSVHDEILRFKLEEAKQMLRSGATSMPDVALSCGFTSVQYLYTVFGRELGCTPRVWRERALSQQPADQAA